MARLFFATALFIFTLIVFIVSIIYIINFVEFPLDSSSIWQNLVAGLLISFSGGGAIVSALSIIRQIVNIMKPKDEFEDELPQESFTDKFRSFFGKFFKLRKSVTFVYVSVLLILVVAGGIIWKIAYSDGKLANVESINNQSTNNPGEKPQQYIEIPRSETDKLSGDAKLSSLYNVFNGHIYNGLEWTIKKLIIRITIFEKDGAIRWSRDFNVSIDLSALSVEDFSINVNNVELTGSYQWNIVKAWGYKEPKP